MGAKLDIRRAGGLTMVELLVVVAIIAIMAGIAIPSFARMGLLWRNDLQASARELYTLLRAARIYATTYNVETAVVYTTYRPEGSTANNLRAAAMMYGYESKDKGFVFRPVSYQDQGSFRFLPGDTALLYNQVVTQNGQPKLVIPGCEDVRVYFPASDSYENDTFYAHIFEPSGRLRAGGSQKEFYSFRIGYTADASVDEQLIDPAVPSDPYNPDDRNIRKIDINLYRATGRVEISSD
ncbi:MAG: prepilin-type N-terminal cleavage/methylation domain-containing protein [Candidatus Hydrogenedentes bacterium]|nr:prepilin-type N-terminal cleavage/methylation domain-containing protein [Candidatus Hydrogenedentota bacterium]